MPSLSANRITPQLSLALLSIAFGYSVLQYGGVVLVDWNIALLFIGLSAIIYLPRNSAADPQPFAVRCALLLPCYVALQLIPLPLFLLRILSPARAAVLDTLGTLTPPVKFAALSVSPGVTSEYLFRIIAYTLTFIVVFDISRRSAKLRPWFSVIPLISIAALEAGWSLWQNAQGIEVEGTYANRNHLAGMLEMALPLTLAYGLALFQRARSGRTSNRSLVAACMVLAVAAGIFGALLSSLSKMGFIAALTGVFVMGLITIATRLRAWRKSLALVCMTALFLFVFIFVPPDELVNRFSGVLSDQQPAGEGRVPIGEDTLRLIAAYPLLGSGLGTYGTAFLKYQTSVVDFVFTCAHNDYLQLTAELGIVGFLLLVATGLPVLTTTFRAASSRAGPDLRWLGTGCLGAFSAIALHSLADFNLYIPANALLLAWISGIAASLVPATVKGPVPLSARPLTRSVCVVLAFLLLLYAPAWILFESLYRSDPRKEAAFCHFGICDTDAIVAAMTLDHGGKIADVPSGELLQALRRDSNDPNRWCDAGVAFLKSGQISKAKACFAEAVKLGPDIPTVRIRASDFYASLHQTVRALAQRSRVLKATETYDSLIFDWYSEKKLSIDDILASGLPEDRRVYQAYLRYLMNLGRVPDSTIVWRSLSSHGYADDRLAGEYVALLFNEQMYEAAARSWADYLGARGRGYLESTAVFNGDFESEPSKSVFDWRIDERNDVEVARDAAIAHTGTHSLRVRFGSQGNVDYSQISQTVFIRPGTYRFEAFIRTQDITTDQGVGFRILDPEEGSRMNIATERFTGTHDWTKVERTIAVLPKTRLLRIQLIREPSQKFDNNIGGTAWIDSVSLSPIK
jgi:O-antigen ligase/tetratricopeptide (TPR) repeat protein